MAGIDRFVMGRTNSPTVMPGLVPGIHVLAAQEDVDGRDKPGHDAEYAARVLSRCALPRLPDSQCQTAQSFTTA
jgi:hypothetical protein